MSDMINRLQPFMRDSKIYKEIFKSEETELSDKYLAIDDLEKQLEDLEAEQNRLNLELDKIN